MDLKASWTYSTNPLHALEHVQQATQVAESKKDKMPLPSVSMQFQMKLPVPVPCLGPQHF